MNCKINSLFIFFNHISLLSLLSPNRHYFLGSGDTVVACDLGDGSFFRVLAFSEYSIDLMEFYCRNFWRRRARGGGMKQADVNCAGGGGKVLVCERCDV